MSALSKACAGLKRRETRAGNAGHLMQSAHIDSGEVTVEAREGKAMIEGTRTGACARRCLRGSAHPSADTKVITFWRALSVAAHPVPVDAQH